MPLIHDKRLAETPPVFTVLRSFFARFDALQILPMLALLAAGVLFIYGTGQQVGGVYAEFWQRQLVWIGLGLVLWLVFSLFDYHFYGIFALALYPVSLFLLVYVLFFGVKFYGARRWLDIAGVRSQRLSAGAYVPRELYRDACYRISHRRLHAMGLEFSSEPCAGRGTPPASAASRTASPIHCCRHGGT